ncbi:hypothetical protein A2467_02455 [Candidatus Nomurabacteria bacterium RIFOXYC2_FULL_36_8]|nr:MAG: hypothetical protein UR97_C0008G0007 [Candidatus Nomurabacteria bacterium GW2011_GWE2_36_115]KKP93342.1 MAG: hypothetical protein US00_C0008G0019 [Candidatus Nomurabacteria bacterium GW2011_GWF2_36_126]KKP96392.1 MAG: hypothetical protein US04_C0002G0066 [Candidatus Nomurabacteria bacterium GW2011_GWD2_36_14]KKP99134.1 MAG: hypothetical protein US08_C0003G0028 [Candidatus Nomurabacteria bacterium GW2011_GWF2_36_19]KKQ05035.1 MAG: hypothetical protein US17_C0008G0007 [Candidatus Nomuraba
MNKKKNRKGKSSIPEKNDRKKIIIDFLNSLGSDLSEFGSECKYNVHDLENTVISIFYQERNKLPFHECLKTLEVLLSDELKVKKQSIELELVSA